MSFTVSASTICCLSSAKVQVAYIPKKKVIGLSKIPRIVEVFARRLQVQERMTVQIANFLKDTLKPKGVAVVVNGYHLCMAMRGVRKSDANMLTSSMLGAFRKDERTRIGVSKPYRSGQ